MTWHYIAYACAVDPAKCRRTQSYPVNALQAVKPSGLGLAIMAPTWPGAHCLDADGAWSRSGAWQGRCFLVWSFDGEMDGETF